MPAALLTGCAGSLPASYGIPTSWRGFCPMEQRGGQVPEFGKDANTIFVGGLKFHNLTHPTSLAFHPKFPGQLWVSCLSAPLIIAHLLCDSIFEAIYASCYLSRAICASHYFIYLCSMSACTHLEFVQVTNFDTNSATIFFNPGGSPENPAVHQRVEWRQDNEVALSHQSLLLSESLCPGVSLHVASHSDCVWRIHQRLQTTPMFRAHRGWLQTGMDAPRGRLQCVFC